MKIKTVVIFVCVNIVVFIVGVAFGVNSKMKLNTGEIAHIQSIFAELKSRSKILSTLETGNIKEAVYQIEQYNDIDLNYLASIIDPAKLDTKNKIILYEVIERRRTHPILINHSDEKFSRTIQHFLDSSQIEK